MAETRPGSWCELAESPWEGLNHRKGMVKRRTLGNTRHPNMGTEKEKHPDKHLPYVQAHAWYWREAAVGGTELRL